MRRSKSDPAKYARNYRRISQRHMTGYDDDGGGGGGGGGGEKGGGAGSGNKKDGEEREKRRLEAILAQSERTWKRGGSVEDDVDGGGGAASADVDNGDGGDGMMSLLSPELRAQFSGMGNDALLVLPSKKKRPQKKKESAPPPTKEEVRAAKALYKNTKRKLQQLEERRRRRELRTGLYRQLEEHALVVAPAAAAPTDESKDGAASVGNVENSTAISSSEARSLLLRSSELGKRLTKKERLKQLRRKEALGIPLTEEERGVLYVRRGAAPSADGDEDNGPEGGGADSGQRQQSASSVMDELKRQQKEVRESKKKKKKKRKGGCGDEESGPRGGEGKTEPRVEGDDEERGARKKARSIEGGPSAADAVEAIDAAEGSVAPPPAPPGGAPSLAQMMLAGLSSLKTRTDARNEEIAEEATRRRLDEEERLATLEEEERRKRKVYVPGETVTVSTMRSVFDDDDDDDDDENRECGEGGGGGGRAANRMVQRINRPESIERSRFDLPVSAMEFEIIDAVRNSDCTILCGETGSGKSTQVPQFLYEAGFSTLGWWERQQKQQEIGNSSGGGGVPESSNDSSDDRHLLIGITQPRRVAAVSTAKRVCYEMGAGSGQSISPDNLVAYQTRYETAGLGPRTRVKFMTDGILLQEIQSDLLLRKYGAIVIDEAHERNLNTDVLLGLLSVALPLRRKASKEGSLPPLKLVVMSATLRVEDFTENARLFPKGEVGVATKPALVKVPGRTHPVSIHHSKVTELDDYEKVAMEKVCKIHRKLPAGGILVFLTGKQEIVRCINRLKQRLEPSRIKKRSIRDQLVEISDATQPLDGNEGAFDGIRDMDDEEVDGDLFQKEDDEDDFDNMEIDEEGVDIDTSTTANDDDKRPKKVRILPLYSMLSADEQAKVFAPVPDDTRLIVIATNIAETSITIPGISYVVDSGRQKCRNYHAGTGVASYDIMWISKAAADQRAGRAGRTGPGHCYRLYSSSVYARYLDEFALPEVLTRPLEDVVLAMKAMNVTNVTSFPFPTPPDQTQVNAAVRLLANLGCVDVSRVEEQGGDGKITPLGAAVAKLPLGVRYGKMLLVAAQANVLDYAIALVAVLSESTPFTHHTEEIDKDSQSGASGEDLEGLDEVDQNRATIKEKERKREMKSKWMHDGGDIMAAVKAVGAYAYAGRGAGGNSEKLACRQFCDENGLHLVVMQRIAKMRLHLCKLAKARLPHAGGIAAETGKYLPSMPPPKRIQECLLRQAIASGLLDNIARRAPPGVLAAEFTGIPRSAYICGNSKLKEPLFIDNNSTMHSKRPEWVCFDSIVRKAKKDGTTVATMQKVTPIDPEWIAALCHGSNLLTLGSPLATPAPRYIKEKDSIQCAVETKFGGHGWEVPPCYVEMYDLIQKESNSNQRKQTSAVMQDDSFRWFARYLLEGKVLPELSGLLPLLNDEPALITRRKPAKKVMLMVSALSGAGVDSATALRKHWAEKDNKFLFKALKPWVKGDSVDDAKLLWISAVNTNVAAWKKRG